MAFTSIVVFDEAIVDNAIDVTGVGFSGEDSWSSLSEEQIIVNPSGDYNISGNGILISDTEVANIFSFGDSIPKNNPISDNSTNVVGIIDTTPFTETGNGYLSVDYDLTSNFEAAVIFSKENTAFAQEGGIQYSVTQINAGCDTSFSPIDVFESGFKCSGSGPSYPPKNVYDIRYKRNRIRL
jgi:hypothetical protein